MKEWPIRSAARRVRRAFLVAFLLCAGCDLNPQPLPPGSANGSGGGNLGASGSEEADAEVLLVNTSGSSTSGSSGFALADAAASESDAGAVDAGTLDGSTADGGTAEGGLDGGTAEGGLDGGTAEGGAADGGRVLDADGG